MEPERLSSELATLRLARGGEEPRQQPRRWLHVAGALAAMSAVAGTTLATVRHLASSVLVVNAGVVRPGASPDASGELAAAGHVVPEHTTKVGAKVTGRVSKSSIVEGQVVRSGEVLFELEDSSQRRAVAVAVAQAESARARVAAARAELAELSTVLSRNRLLAQGDAGPRSAVEDVEARIESGKRRVRVAEAEAGERQAEVEAARGALEDFTILSPVDGVAISKPLGVGNVVDSTIPLVELADYASLRVEVDVPESRLGQLKQDQKVYIILDAYPDRRLAGSLSDIAPKIDRAKATATVKVRVDGSPELLRPDMAARVRFLKRDEPRPRASGTEGALVPASAVVERGGRKVVFVIEAGRAQLVPVEIRDVKGSDVVLERGPAAGVRVVLEPPANLLDRQQIKEAQP